MYLQISFSVGVYDYNVESLNHLNISSISFAYKNKLNWVKDHQHVSFSTHLLVKVDLLASGVVECILKTIKSSYLLVCFSVGSLFFFFFFVPRPL